MHALSIEHLVKTYANGHTALKDVSFDVQKGDFFALLGPNGAGKTTLIGIITSLVNKTSGKVEIFGNTIDKNYSQTKSLIGVVPQEFNFNIFNTVMEIVVNQAGYFGLPRKHAKNQAEKYLKKLDLWGKRKESARLLSGGMKRRLMIARALVHEPKLLILDEPSAGVDIEIRRHMWSFLRDINQQGVTIILTTHYLEEAENLCRNIAIIDQGTIIENTSMQMLLERLTAQSFVLDIKDPISKPIRTENFEIKKLDEKTIEVQTDEKHNITELFSLLNKNGIEVKSLRNKTNRLEELFMRLITEEEKS